MEQAVYCSLVTLTVFCELHADDAKTDIQYYLAWISSHC